VYRAVKDGLLGEGITARTCLRRGGKRHNSRTIQPDRRIGERPAEAERRERTGDLEGDTLHGGMGKGCLLTLVDRKTRKLYAARSLTMESGEIREAFRRVLAGITVRTITLDNGSEFAEFRGIERDTGAEVYFAEPRSPRQRGTNENTNGLLRCYFSKGTDFRAVTDERVREVVDLLNHRPRKCLGWLSPEEFSLKCCT
jgi:IS30 family transposase